jgi:hypothetical protein
MKKLFPAFTLIALMATGAAFADEKKAEPAKAAACCDPKCDKKEGKCATHEAKKCDKECKAACCKPTKKGEHPKGEHPKGEHPKGEHPKGEHPKGEHPKG